MNFKRFYEGRDSHLQQLPFDVRIESDHRVPSRVVVRAADMTRRLRAGFEDSPSVTASGVVLPRVKDRSKVRLSRGSDRCQRDVHSGLDAGSGVAACHSQHGESGVQALLIDGRGLEYPVHDGRGVLPDSRGPLPSP